MLTALDTFLLSQLLIGFALISDIISFQVRKREHILIFLVTSAFLIAVHYLLLGKITAGILVFLSFASFITARKTTNKKYLYFFMILYLIPILLTYDAFVDTVIFIGMYVALIARFQENDKQLRILMMVATSIIITYNALIFTPMGVLLETIFLISNIVGYYRYYVRERKKE